MLALSLWLLASCRGDSHDRTGEPVEPVAARITVEAPRAQMMPGMGAVYLTIHNPADTADHLLSVETPWATVAEIHESLDDDGVVRMVAHPEGFEIPAGSTLELAPGGKHIMLMQVRELPAETSHLPLTLHFREAGAVEIEAPMTALGTDL